jgi:hypothetical protein
MITVKLGFTKILVLFSSTIDKKQIQPKRPIGFDLVVAAIMYLYRKGRSK